ILLTFHDYLGDDGRRMLNGMLSGLKPHEVKLFVDKITRVVEETFAHKTIIPEDGSFKRDVKRDDVSMHAIDEEIHRLLTYKPPFQGDGLHGNIHNTLVMAG